MPLPPLPEPKGLFTRIKGAVKGFIPSFTLMFMLLIINMMQMLSMVIKPFAPKLFRSINRWFANTWWGACHLWAERGYGIEIIVSGDDVPEKESVVVVSNHQEMPDIPVLFKLGYEKGRLGDFKWYVKDILKYVPAVGWGMVFLDCLFVKRNWASDKAHIQQIFANIIDNKIPVWVISFVEGTRIRPKKLQKSNEYAEKHGLKPTRHVLLPRTKGFAATVNALRTHIDAVYDVTIAYVDGVPTLWQWFEGHAPKAYLHVKRFPLDKLPEDEEVLANWLTERFYTKDDLLEHYYNTGILDEDAL